MSENPSNEEAEKPQPGKLRQNLLPLIAIALSVILSVASFFAAEWQRGKALEGLKASIEKSAVHEKPAEKAKPDDLAILTSIARLEQELRATNAFAKEQSEKLADAKADLVRLSKEIAKPATARPAAVAPAISGTERHRTEANRNDGKGGYVSDGKSPWE